MLDVTATTIITSTIANNNTIGIVNTKLETGPVVHINDV